MPRVIDSARHVLLAGADKGSETVDPARAERGRTVVLNFESVVQSAI